MDQRVTEKGVRVKASWCEQYGLSIDDIINARLKAIGCQSRVKKGKLGLSRDHCVPKISNCIKGDETGRIHGWNLPRREDGIAFAMIGM